MRELTEEELKLAPCWATHYVIDCFDDAVYQSEKLCWWDSLSSPLEHGGMDEGAIIIPKKPFDIINHEWSDCRNLKCIGKDKGLETVIFKVSVFNGLAFFDLDKDDAIAIAKHFGLTAEYLK